MSDSRPPRAPVGVAIIQDAGASMGHRVPTRPEKPEESAESVRRGSRQGVGCGGSLTSRVQVITSAMVRPVPGVLLVGLIYSLFCACWRPAMTADTHIVGGDLEALAALVGGVCDGLWGLDVTGAVGGAA